MGTAVQSDWVNSHLAARLPAVVVSVEHRLLDPETPLSAVVDDGWDVLRHVVQHAAHASISRHAHSPTLTMTQMRLFQRLAVPPGTDARAVSPLYAADLSGLAPTLVVVPTVDPVADHGRCYAERLRAAGTPARLTEYPGATHAFLSMPGVVPQAKAARAEIAEFLQGALAG